MSTTANPIRLIYIAGPYRSTAPFGVERNILDANESALAVIRHGEKIGERWLPVIPHAMTRWVAQEAPMDDAFWLATTLELMRRCDALAYFGDWWKSEGTANELREAVKLGKDIYLAHNQLTKHIGTSCFTEE